MIKFLIKKIKILSKKFKSFFLLLIKIDFNNIIIKLLIF